MDRLTRAQLDQLRIELGEIAARAPRFVRQERNQAGQDFVIGGVHGAFDEVWSAMNLAGFDRDRARDRLVNLPRQTLARRDGASGYLPPRTSLGGDSEFCVIRGSRLDCRLTIS